MPRKDSPYEVKHDPDATWSETQAGYTKAKHAWRFLHPDRREQYCLWCLYQLSPRKITIVLNELAVAFRVYPPRNLKPWNRDCTPQELSQMTIDLIRRITIDPDQPDPEQVDRSRHLELMCDFWNGMQESDQVDFLKAVAIGCVEPDQPDPSSRPENLSKREIEHAAEELARSLFRKINSGDRPE